jgi:hypothetical protein
LAYYIYNMSMCNIYLTSQNEISMIGACHSTG